MLLGQGDMGGSPPPQHDASSAPSPRRRRHPNSPDDGDASPFLDADALVCYRSSQLHFRQSPRCKAVMGFLVRLHSPVVLLSLTVFLLFVMLKLRETSALAWSWPSCFAPLWFASALGVVCTVYRLWGQDIRGRSKSYVVEQLNSLIFWLATSAVLILVSLQTSGQITTLVSVLCSPFWVAMVLQFMYVCV